MQVDESAREHQAREIELELIRVRSAAEAARLEARAAELELMLRRMARGVSSSEAPITHPISFVESPSHFVSEGQGSQVPDSWSSRLSRLQSRSAGEHSFSGPAAAVSDLGNPAVESPRDSRISVSGNATIANDGVAEFWRPTLPSVDDAAGRGTASPSWSRFDSGSSSLPSPHLSNPSSLATDVSLHRDEPEDLRKDALEPLGRIVSSVVDLPSESALGLNPSPMPASSKIEDPVAGFKESLKRSVKTSLPIPIPKIQTGDDDSEEQSSRKFRPASMLVSTLAHVAVLIFLGLMTLASNPPKDQLAFTSSVSESSEESVETFEIESSEPTEPTEPVSETAYDVSELGTMAITEVSLDAPPAMATPTASDMFSSSSSSLSSSAMKSLKGDATAKTQFCGVDGGGNHFVYLVDSSGSMRDGFQSARDELLASIDQLKPDQRFYVVFFDDDPAYMRLSDPNVDESGSVMATPENKKRLRAWAMTVQMDKGKAPYDVLPFALTLRPDVIFLLSDGEFPTKIEEILREQNHEENLFGESGPISIVHTIRYHGLEGQVGKDAEATMVKIAKENGGQYRHVPKPKT